MTDHAKLKPDEIIEALDRSLRMPGPGDRADHEYDPDCWCRFCRVRTFTLVSRGGDVELATARAAGREHAILIARNALYEQEHGSHFHTKPTEK